MSAPYYERYWSEEGFNPRREWPAAHLVRLFALHVLQNDDCLDLGCGDGGTSGTYLTKHAGSYIGVDVSARAIEMATGRGLDARVIEDAGRLPFDDGSFDVVVCTEVFEHLFEPSRAAAEAFRVLRDGGRLIATVPNGAYWRDRVDMLFGLWQPGGDDLGREEPWRSPHIRFFQAKSLERMLRGAGFADIRVEGIAFPVFARVPVLRRHNVEVGPLARALAAARPTFFADGLAVVARRGSAF